MSIWAETEEEAIEFIKRIPYYHAVAIAESAMNPEAENPKSTAKGIFQLTSSTRKALYVWDWKSVVQQLVAMRLLTHENIVLLESQDPNILYGAHFCGVTTMRKVVRGIRLNASQKKWYDEYLKKALPRFQEIYRGIIQ